MLQHKFSLLWENKKISDEFEWLIMINSLISTGSTVSIRTKTPLEDLINTGKNLADFMKFLLYIYVCTQRSLRPLMGGNRKLIRRASGINTKLQCIK